MLLFLLCAGEGISVTRVSMVRRYIWFRRVPPLQFITETTSMGESTLYKRQVCKVSGWQWRLQRRHCFIKISWQEDYYFEKSLKTPFSVTCPAITFARPDKPAFTKSEDFEVKKTDFACFAFYIYRLWGMVRGGEQILRNGLVTKWTKTTVRWCPSCHVTN